MASNSTHDRRRECPLHSLSRRDFLTLIGGAGAALLAPGLTLRAAAAPVELDVAIVGGGVSGLYAGWSLMTRGVRQSAVLAPLLGSRERLDVGLFELSERLGGRLYSVPPPDAPHLRAEMGGMRYLTTQQLVPALIRHLDIPTLPFPFGDDHNLNYLRGSRFTVGDLEAYARNVPYNLPPDERGMTTDELLQYAIRTFVPDAATMTPNEWTQRKRTLQINGKPVYDWGFMDLIHTAITGDAFELVEYGDGYRSLVENYNAADLLQMLSADFADPTYLTPRDGYQSLPLTLAERFLAAGGRVQTGTRLRTLERVVTDGTPKIRLILQAGAQTQVVDARHVVLAMPRRSIELLDPTTFLFRDSQFRADLNAVASIPGSKLFLAYREPWWEKIQILNGRSVTDLPLRQCVYFGTEGDRPGADPNNRNSLLTATYNDGEATAFWAQFLGKSPPFPAKGPVPADAIAPDQMVLETHSQLARLHGLLIPEPYWAAYKDWGLDPFGGAWHFWQVGQKSFEVMPRIRKPIADANLTICGEAWSANQGWVEGALATAEHVLQDHFGLQRPDWLSADVELGP
jgi:lysine 2-monooxygenase